MSTFVKTYTLPSGQTFETITIPKGTLLFHGTEEKKYPHEYFEYFIGLPQKIPASEFNLEHTMRIVSPHSQMFFYPAPYISDVVDKFNLHIAYYTQYDLEIMLLVQPSNHSRQEYPFGDPLTDAYVTCNILGEKDQCGFPMDDQNPCFTPATLELLPYLNGYIAIADTDASKFKAKLAASMRTYNSSFLEDSLPFIISNSRGIQSIPEISIHPFYRRDQNCLELSPRFMLDGYKRYLRNNRPSYALYPAFIFSDNGILSICDFLNLDHKSLEKFINFTDGTYYAQRPMYKYIQTFINSALTPSGYISNGICNLDPFVNENNILSANKSVTHLSIDSRTGFYIIRGEAYDDKPLSNINVRINSNFEIPFTISANSKKYIRAHLTRNLPYLKEYFKSSPLVFEANLEMFFERLKAAGINGRPYVFQKGDKEKYVRGYHLDELVANKRKMNKTSRSSMRFGSRHTHRRRNKGYRKF